MRSAPRGKGTTESESAAANEASSMGFTSKLVNLTWEREWDGTDKDINGMTTRWCIKGK